MAEFLPLCDVLFNVISLAGYFCDVVFDVVFCYALLERGRTIYFSVVILLIGFSLLISQIVSIRWYMNKTIDGQLSINSIDKKQQKITKILQNQTKNVTNITAANESSSYISRYCIIALHLSQMGVLWRYAKLFVPVDLRHVKNEVRDLCMLRLVHAFCEAAPMLLLQLHVFVTMQNEDYIIANPEIKLKSLGGHITTAQVQQPSITQQHQLRTFKDLNVVSAVLSLFSVCWALASFSKNVRLQNVHRLVLTWLGVIFQFLWRLGTVVSRVTSLTVYASLYGYWILLVIVLHWISMFLWLISPKNVFHGERISRLRKAIFAWLIAFVYVFAYINLQEVNHRQKMITFYVVMFMENMLLVCLWLVGVWPDRPIGWWFIPILVLSSFSIGMAFMLLYYRYFHVRRLGYEAGGRFPADITAKCSNNGIESGSVFVTTDSQAALECSKYSSHAIPGVFNCRFSNPVGNGATKRKKKKPTTFIPPPILGLTSHANESDADGGSTGAGSNGLMSIPFWRRPLPRSHTGGSSENEGSAGSRVNIYQKLQEKKQKQLAELKIIEEEIKQGKLGGPTTNTLESGDDGRGSLMRQPIPRVKKHINVEPIEWRSNSPEMVTAAAAAAAQNVYNDLNVLSSSNIDDVNNLNKYTNNYDPLYNSFGLNGINIPALAPPGIDTTVRNMSPISSVHVSATESSLTRSVMPRAKMHLNMLRNPFAETYRGNYPNVYADSGNGHRPPSISPRNTANSPNRGVVSVTGAGTHYDHHADFCLEINHPRQISGTYSGCVVPSGIENLPFPYNVIPPPKSKLDSRLTPTAPILNANKTVTNNGCGSSGLPPVIQNRLQRQIQRAKTPEILLAPHYLDNSRIYYDWVARDPMSNRMHPQQDRQQICSSGDENLDEHCNDGHGRIPSDIDSQVSLPRSYTLPREFKYYRRNKCRKLIKNEHFITSTNSSDGDVDSGDDNESERHSNRSSNHTPINNSQRRLRRNNNFHNQTPTTGVSLNNVVNHSVATPPPPPSSSSSSHHAGPLNTIYSDMHNISATSSTSGIAIIGNGICGGSASSNYINSAMLLDNKSSSMHHNLDLISNVSGIDGKNIAAGSINNNNNNNNAMNRQIRLRVYGNAKSGMVRHETKL